MPFDALILETLTMYQIPAVFVGSFFFGEGVLISSFYLATILQWSLAATFAVALVGTLASDSLWYAAGRYGMGVAEQWMRRRGHEQLLEKLEQKSHHRLALVLLYLKFLYGTRILMISYISWQKVPYMIFLLYDTIGTAIWLAAMAGIGWLIGQGATNLVPAFDRLQVILVVVLGLILSVRLASRWIVKRITNE